MKKILLFLLICLNTFAFKLENITFNKSLKNGYREYILYNDGTRKVRYKITILPSGEKDVTKCLEVFPKIVTIEPQSSQVFKIFGKGGEKLENKEYYFNVRFDQIIIPTLGKADGKTVSGTSIMAITPTVEMKGYGGEIDYSKHLSFENIKYSKDKKGVLQVEGDIINSSHGGVELGLNFHSHNKKASMSKGFGEIPAKSKKRVKISLTNFNSKDDIGYLTFYGDTFEILKEVELENGMIVEK